jgi:hypothetical protein
MPDHLAFPYLNHPNASADPFFLQQSAISNQQSAILTSFVLC